jgi:hypothetical protein
LEADKTMNVTHIFLSNGQWNWDAIGTIISVILAAALVWIKWGSLKKVSEQTEQMIKDRKRNRILEAVKDFLTPTMHSLEDEIKAIQGNEIHWEIYTKDKAYIMGLSKRLPDKIDYTITTTKYPNLKTQLLSHDKLYNRLNELCDEIRSEIVGSEFKKRLRVLIDRFNEKRDITKQLTEDRRGKSENVYAGWIISKGIFDRSPDQNTPYFDFWDRYKDELLRFISTPRIQNHKREIGAILDQLKELNEKLSKEIKGVIGKYREEYDLTKDEIDPTLKKLLDW